MFEENSKIPKYVSTSLRNIDNPNLKVEKVHSSQKTWGGKLRKTKDTYYTTTEFLKYYQPL